MDRRGSSGLVFLLPTDTVYGFHASVYDKKAQRKIREIKRRGQNKSFIVLVSSLKDLEEFSVDLGERKRKFLKRIWPGPHTVILKIGERKFKYLTNENGEVAFRIPAEKRLLEFIKKFGPLVSTSANLSGREVLEYGKDLQKEVERIWGEEAEKIDYGIESYKKKEEPSLILKILR